MIKRHLAALTNRVFVVSTNHRERDVQEPEDLAYINTDKGAGKGDGLTRTIVYK